MRGKRLHQVIVSSQLQAFDAIVHRVARAEYQHGRARLTTPDFLEDPQAVHIGQHQVEDHKIVLGTVDQLYGGAPIARDVDGIACAFQPSG